MSDSARDLLVRGIAAAKAKDKGEARFYLEWALRSEPDADQRLDAWLWLGEVSDDRAEKRDYLERVLAENMAHPVARRKLALLDGRLNPADLVDPDRLAAPVPGAAQPAEARRFTCPTCGGRLSFSPDGGSLTCDYCDTRQTLDRPAAGVAELDFAVALATAKGHRAPVAVRSLACGGCGAVFMLAPAALSLTCPFCASVYVVEAAETRELIPPAGVLPFAISEAAAEQTTRRWIEEHADTRAEARVAGLYVPAWTFDLTLDMQWTRVRTDGPRQVTETGNTPVNYDDVLVPAGQGLPEPLVEELAHYPLRQLAAYEPSYLADWPAQVYTISAAEASLEARAQSLGRARSEVAAGLALTGPEAAVKPQAIYVTEFKLVLLPAWLAHYAVDGKQYDVVVNGYTGAVRGERPSGGVRKVLDWLLRENA